MSRIGQSKRPPSPARSQQPAAANNLRVLPDPGSTASDAAEADVPSEATGTAPREPELAIVAAVSPALRAKKVARLKAAIADGTYTADPREIAERILASGLGDQP